MSWDFDIPEFFNIGVACTEHQNADAIAMIIEDETRGTSTISYGVLNDQSNKIAGFLREIGAEPRDRVLLCMHNSLAYPIGFFGTIKSGLIAVPTSTLLSGAEVRYLAADSQAKAIILSAAVYRNLVPHLENLANLRHIIVADIDDVSELFVPRNTRVYSLSQILADTAPIAQPYNSKAGEPAYLVYTSGTTGFPKGVLHSHRSLLGRMPASKYWFDFKEGDRIMHSGKFNWTYVLGSALMDPLYLGHTVIAYEGKNEPQRWIDLIAKHKCTIFIGVPTIYRQIIQRTEASNADVPSLRHCMSAGEHLSAEMIHAWQARFQQDIYEAIGMSEFSYYISHSIHNPIRPGSAGFVQPGHKVFILNPDTLEPVGVEEEGMICIGEDDPGLFLEYWQLEEETRKARRNGYFYTGDYAKRDADGYIWFLGRKDDIINTFGYRVSPHEIERIMKTHPKVADAVAVGLSVDANKTIIALAVVGHSPLSNEDEAAILHFGEQNLASYKCPKMIYSMDSFPRTKNGKVLRKELIQLLQPESESASMFKPAQYRARRSILLVPASNARYIEKARTALADGVIFDLVSTLPEKRVEARALLQASFEKSSDFGYSERILRVNPIGSQDIEKDLELAKNIAIDALVFAEIETPAQIKSILTLTQDMQCELMINIETPLGVLNAQAILSASTRIAAVILGTNHLAARMHLNIKRDRLGLHYAREQMVITAKAYGTCVIDGPHFDIADEFSCEASTKEAFLLGFDGKALIHPIQIEYINDIFTPKQNDVEKAKRMIEAFDEAIKAGNEVLEFEDELINRSQIAWAERTVMLYDRYRELGQERYF